MLNLNRIELNRRPWGAVFEECGRLDWHACNSVACGSRFWMAGGGVGAMRRKRQQPTGPGESGERIYVVIRPAR